MSHALIPKTNRFIEAAASEPPEVYPDVAPLSRQQSMLTQSAAEQAAKPQKQVVYLGGIGRFACWWFVILSMLGIVAALLSIK